jgi:hypothetical protein
MKVSECEDVELLRNIVEKLWDIIDDIDTASDMAKDNDRRYRNRVEFLQRQRFDYVMSDGYELFIKPDEQ